MSESGAHVLIFPYPAQGHMIPLLDFTRHLATAGLTITILVTPKNLPLLNPLLSKHAIHQHPRPPFSASPRHPIRRREHRRPPRWWFPVNVVRFRRTQESHNQLVRKPPFAAGGHHFRHVLGMDPPPCG
ncbi:UDP-glycosyltransferase 89B2-like [Abeliophyllum distichum]|uniref:UDP-glycosyltransferase 89B2-like n=1 Tax=Abeliophyllum distichum TaxID=126358 RepID=A0ABD1PNZ1_9LAMI